MFGRGFFVGVIYAGFTIFGPSRVYRGMDVIVMPRNECRNPVKVMRTHWSRVFFLWIIMLLSQSVFATEAWPALPFVEARAYAWPVEGTKGGLVILPGIKLREDVINKEGAVLNPDQVKRLQAALSGKHAKHALIRCYSPHNAVVFYDSGKRPVAFVEICFDCLGAGTMPKAPAEWKDFPALAKIFAELKLPIGRSGDLENFNKFFDSARR